MKLKKLQTLLTLNCILLFSISTYSQEVFELPFFDDFEKENINNITFTKWTTENLLGSKFWFTMLDWNNNPGQFLYFGNSYNIENDWLITKPINCKGINRLKIDFDVCFRDSKIKPKLFYTNSYNGDASLSNWTELDYISSQVTYTWQHSAEIIFDNHEDTIYIAFQYQAAASAGTTFMFDNFMVRSYTPSTPFELVGLSEHFEFYGNLPADNLKHWNQISSDIDYWYKELCSYWDRPGIAPIFNSKEKIKIFLGDSNAFENELSVVFPNWKYNYIKSKNEIYLKLPDAGTDNIYAGDLITLVKNSLAQLIINLHFVWKCESYLAEGFGLYYGGYRPNKEKIVQGLADLGAYIELYDIRNLNELDKSYKKDLLVSYIEAQALSCFGIQRIGSNYPVVWPNHLEYYYNKPDNERIKLQKQSDHFFIYAADQDIQFIDSISKSLEEKLSYYQTAFDTIISHPFNFVIYPNVETASACLGRSTDANGGGTWSGDKLDVISKLNYLGSRDYFKIINHELFHAFHFNLVTFLFNIPAFHFEGMAEIMTFEGKNVEMLAGKSMEFRDGLTRFINENGREPMLAEIMNVPYMSVYTYGQAFWHYMHKNYADYPTIKKFFINGCNWNVFDIPYEQIDSEYIVYLKTLAGMVNSAPDVESNAPSVITKVSANLNGNVISDGGATITQRGFYWSSTNSSPNSGDHVELVSGTRGSFSKTLENLTAETTYYFRAFATNSLGTSLGEVKQFKTLIEPVLAELPFSDNFEDEDDTDFYKWTAENLEGWHYWHVIAWNGIGGGHCMRFQNTEVDQDDWLITNPINCAGVKNLKVNFSHLFHGPKVPPRLFYTNQYNGNASQSVWKELTYSFGENENQWYPSEDFIIENPGDVIYVAFHYQASANEGTYFLLDNVVIESIKPDENIQSDSLTLIALYNATGGSNWNNNDNWLTGQVSSWYGITVENNRVVRIDLNNNNLSGTLPAEIGQLTALKDLILWGNQITGNIPVEIVTMYSLVTFDLGLNNLTGTIPVQFGQLSNLENLFIGSGSQLTGTIPSQLGKLTKLKIIALDQNQLTGSVPEEFGNLHNLNLLFLEGNQLSYLPDLSSLENLNLLNCSYNQLTFSDLEPNMGIPEFYYSPQGQVGMQENFQLVEGDNFSYVLTVGGEFNQYQWYKDGEKIDSQTSATLEINDVDMQDAGNYYCEVTNTSITGLILTCREINLLVEGKFKLTFNMGWNIFSSPVMLDDKNLMNILQPLIDAGSLIKIQDENGNSMEDWGIFGGWKNNIDSISPVEGYKIKVSVLDSLEIYGANVDYPYPIPLKSGWNIIGFPQRTSYDGMESVVQQLIDRTTLIKVQDEEGNSIEDWGVFGGWKNNIGDFIPGEGYKIKVSTNDTLWIFNSYQKSSVIVNELIATTHFKPEFEGNGLDHMNINLVSLPINMLKARDELAIFDGAICVGAITLLSHHLISQTVSIVASANDIQGMPGFIEGNQFILKLWNSQQNREFVLDSEIVKGTSTFVKNETTIVSLEKYAITGLDEYLISGLTEIKCYPNPFSNEVTIEINLVKDAEVQVEMLNQLGQRVKLITTKQIFSGGKHKLTWNGRNANNQQVSPGIYFLNIGIDDVVYYRKIILSK